MSKWENLADEEGLDEVSVASGKKRKKRTLAQVDEAVARNHKSIDMLEDETLAATAQRQSMRLHIIILAILLVLTIGFSVWQHYRIDDLESDLTLLKADYDSHDHPHRHSLIPHYH